MTMNHSTTTRRNQQEPSFAPLSISSNDDPVIMGTPTNVPNNPNNISTDGAPESYHFETNYRGGFSTSICDLFQDPRDRSSCCALTCFGTFLQDRNRYLLTGELPPPWWVRFVVYIGGFLLSILLGSLVDPTAVLVFPLAFVVFMMMRATSMRQHLRQQLQVRMLEAQPNNTSIQTHGNRCEHWCCALVPNDKRKLLIRGPPPPQLERELQERARRQQADFCFRLWQLLGNLCCNSCCFSWCHWCGMCASGQEDRELKRLLPPEVFMRDYITFQPFGEYYPSIEWLREEGNMNFWSHLGALSELSRKLLRLLQVSILLLLVVAILHIVNNFSIAKVFVVVLTLAQAFLILYVVYWRNHRLDVSLDAIIKFFASGFILAMTAALVVEVILDFIGEVIFSIVLTNEYIEDHPEILQMDDDYAISHGGPFSNIDTFKTMAQEHYPTLLIYLFFKAIVVAGLVEEMTKYFCFWMVEHPDYIYGSPRHINEEMGEEGEFCNTASSDSVPVTPPTSPSESATTNIRPFRPRKAPNHMTAAAAITVGMIATAVGFSCSENLLYVFSQNSVAGEISVLLARSALPVHSICAAIQSIGVVRRDVEQDSDYRIGRAIFPAVLLHGMFDFILLALAFFEYIFADTTDDGYAENPSNDDWVNNGNDDLFNQPDKPQTGPYFYKETAAQQTLSFSIGAALTMLGVVYYVNEAGKQRHRLQALDMTTAEVPSTSVLVFT